MRASDHPGAKSAAHAYPRIDSLWRLELTLESRNLRKDDPKLVSAAYTLAGSAVTWWIERFGIEKIREALTLIGEGYDPNTALRKVTRFAVGDMDPEWRAALMVNGSQPPTDDASS